MSRWPYDPVYSFWLSSFERLNGMLGSYHTNYHDISLQLMRRFISSSFYNVNNWPVEYTDQFYPLLSKHHYEEGSLQAISLDHVLEVCKFEDVRPLPPVYEVALELHQKEAQRAFMLYQYYLILEINIIMNNY